MLLAERLADYTVSLNYGDLPERVIHATRQRLVDSIGCALGAIDSETSPARACRSNRHARFWRFAGPWSASSPSTHCSMLWRCLFREIGGRRDRRAIAADPLSREQRASKRQRIVE